MWYNWSWRAGLLFCCRLPGLLYLISSPVILFLFTCCLNISTSLSEQLGRYIYQYIQLYSVSPYQYSSRFYSGYHMYFICLYDHHIFDFLMASVLEKYVTCACWQIISWIDAFVISIDARRAFVTFVLWMIKENTEI